jgi:hypothetical protein
VAADKIRKHNGVKKRERQNEHENTPR